MAGADDDPEGVSRDSKSTDGDGFFGMEDVCAVGLGIALLAVVVAGASTCNS